MAEVAALKALCYMHRLAARMAERVQGASPIESSCLDDECLAFPPARRVSHPRRVEIFEQLAAAFWQICKIGFWIAFSKLLMTHVPQQATIMPSLMESLSPDDLQRVAKALRAKGISVTSIRNHTLGEQPQFVFVDFRGEGAALDLAKAVR